MMVLKLILPLLAMLDVIMANTAMNDVFNETYTEMSTWPKPTCILRPEYSGRRTILNWNVTALICTCPEKCNFNMDQVWDDMLNPINRRTQYIAFQFTCSNSASVFWNATQYNYLDHVNIRHCILHIPDDQFLFANESAIPESILTNNTVKSGRNIYAGWKPTGMLFSYGQPLDPDVDFPNAGRDFLCKSYTINGAIKKVPQLATFKMMQNLNFLNNNFTTEDLLQGNDTYNARVIMLSENRIRNLSSYRFKGETQFLYIKQNGLASLGNDTFVGLNVLKEIYLQKNLLTSLPSYVFRNIPTLEVINLSENSLGESDLSIDLFKGLTNLKVIKLDNNRLTFLLKGIFSGLDKLDSLSLQGNILQVIPQEIFLLPKLALLDMSSNNITSHGLLQLFRNSDETTFKLSSNRRKLKLENNSIHTFPMNELLTSGHIDIFKRSLSGILYYLGKNPFVCQCGDIYELYMLMYEYIQKTDVLKTYSDNIQCSSPPNLKGRKLYELDKKDILCPKTTKVLCPSQCDCFTRVYNNRTVVNCTSRGLIVMPSQIPHNTATLLLQHNNIQYIKRVYYFSFVTEINLAHNSITDIPHNFLKHVGRLHSIDLSYNSIKYIPNKVLSALGKMSNMSLSIHHNHLACDCNSLTLKRWISDNRNKLNNLEDTKCFGGHSGGNPILETSDRSFICLNVILPAVLVPIVLIAICILLVVIFRKEIRVILYHKFNWHLTNNHTEDDTTIYDAFISYCSADEKWVIGQLAKRLELSRYKVCHHQKSFEPGLAIADNIVRSIDQSKRTILVLSNNFLDSDWCKYEFQAAHYRALKYRQKYLIIVMLENIDTSKLDKTLRLYVKTNGVVKITERLFWQKLLYEMPVLKPTELIEAIVIGKGTVPAK